MTSQALALPLGLSITADDSDQTLVRRMWPYHPDESSSSGGGGRYIPPHANTDGYDRWGLRIHEDPHYQPADSIWGGSHKPASPPMQSGHNSPVHHHHDRHSNEPEQYQYRIPPPPSPVRSQYSTYSDYSYDTENQDHSHLTHRSAYDWNDHHNNAGFNSHPPSSIESSERHWDASTPGSHADPHRQYREWSVGSAQTTPPASPSPEHHLSPIHEETFQSPRFAHSPEEPAGYPFGSGSAWSSSSSSKKKEKKGKLSRIGSSMRKWL